MTHFLFVGYAGACPFQSTGERQFVWRLMDGHISPLLRSGSPRNETFLEQDVLPSLQLRDSEHPPLRLTLCGLTWNGESCHSTSLEGLLSLQACLDVQGSEYLDQLDGDFSLAYITPDGSRTWLHRSITSTRGLYYRVTDSFLMWSTNPMDLLQGTPTLDDVDRAMVAIVAATGIAEPERTCYRGVYCVPSGQRIGFQNGEIISSSRCDYVQREDNSHLSYEVASKRLREHIERAVWRALYGFPSCNIFLSGGLDTAIVAYEAIRLGKVTQGFHWTWNHPIFRDERARAQGLAGHLGIAFHQLDFSASLVEGGEYLRALQGLSMPYNHAFYHCFSRTIAEVSALNASEVCVLAGGHLGDTLFQGDWADAFRLVQRSPKALLGLLRDLLAWYPRKQAFTIFVYHLLGASEDLEGNPSEERIRSNQSLLTPWAFEQVQAFGSVDYRYRQSVAWKQRSVSTRQVLASLQSNIAFNEALETAITYQDSLTQRVVLRHPFSDRWLHEFCLSLGAHHRARWYAGQRYDKFLLRLAYLDDLPPSVIRQGIRTPYAAISEQFCLRNRDLLRQAFGQDCLLHQLGILDQGYVQEILDESESCQRHSRSLFRIAGVEMWLRGLREETKIISAQPQVARVSIQEMGERFAFDRGVVTLEPQVVARQVNDNCVLIHRQTLQVSRFDDTGMLYWNALTQERSWSDVIARLHAHQPEASLEEMSDLVYTFARDLAKAGWITLRKTEEEKYEV